MRRCQRCRSRCHCRWTPAPRTIGTKRTNLTGSKFLRELLAKFAVALEIPLAAHRLPAGAKPLDMQQHPGPPARRAGAGTSIVLDQTPVDIGGPADVGQIPIFGAATEDIDEAWHPPIVRDS